MVIVKRPVRKKLHVKPFTDRLMTDKDSGGLISLINKLKCLRETPEK